MPTHIAACSASEVVPGRAKTVRIEGRLISLFKIGAQYYAVDAVCPHRGAALVRAEISEKRRELICPWHRFRFSLESGRCVASTGRPGLRRYEVREEEGEIIVGTVPLEGDMRAVGISESRHAERQG